MKSRFPNVPGVATCSVSHALPDAFRLTHLMSSAVLLHRVLVIKEPGATGVFAFFSHRRQQRGGCICVEIAPEELFFSKHDPDPVATRLNTHREHVCTYNRWRCLVVPVIVFLLGLRED